MPRKVKVTINCPDRYKMKVGERCDIHHFKEVDAADFYVDLYGSSQNEFAAREFAHEAFKALLDRLKELGI